MYRLTKHSSFYNYRINSLYFITNKVNMLLFERFFSDSFDENRANVEGDSLYYHLQFYLRNKINNNAIACKQAAISILNSIVIKIVRFIFETPIRGHGTKSYVIMP